jgi:hypothetical protein
MMVVVERYANDLEAFWMVVGVCFHDSGHLSTAGAAP